MKNKLIFSIVCLFLPLASKAAVSLENPLEADSVPELVSNVIRGLLGIVGAIALFYLIWGGIVWLTSGGSAERVKKGKDTIVWAIYGLLIIFFSYVIVNYLFTELLA